MNLYNQYRPKKWDEVLGQDAALARLRIIINRGVGGHAFWISGPSGTGKTSIALLIANEIADALCITEIDAVSATPTMIDDVDLDFRSKALLDRPGKALIINEAHGLRTPAVRKLLVMLERIPPYCCVIFTTTIDGKASFEESKEDATPLLSRCASIRLTNQGLNRVFSVRGKEIAEAERLGSKPILAYEEFLSRNKNNFRAMLSAIESGEFLYQEERAANE